MTVEKLFRGWIRSKCCVKVDKNLNYFIMFMECVIVFFYLFDNWFIEIIYDRIYLLNFNLKTLLTF